MGEGKRVIIVGNGESLNGSKKGEFIDSFDIVVRMNKYIIEGCEEDVGEKTDACMMNTRTFMHYFTDNDLIDRLEDIQDVYVIIRRNERLQNYISLKTESYIVPMAWDLMERNKNVHEYDVELMITLHDMLGIKTPCIACERSKELMISSGLYAIAYYIKQGYDVSIIGFDSMDLHMKFDENGWDIPIDKLTHYQGEGLLNVGLEHKVFAEARLLRGLVGLNIISRVD